MISEHPIIRIAYDLPEEEYRVPYTPRGYHVRNCWSLPQNSFKNRFYDRYLCRYWKSWWNSFTVLRSLSVLLQPHLHKSFLKVLILEVSSFYSNFTGKRTRADLRTTNSTPNTPVSFLWLFRRHVSSTKHHDERNHRRGTFLIIDVPRSDMDADTQSHDDGREIERFIACSL